MDIGYLVVYAACGLLLLLFVLSTLFGMPGNLLLVIFAGLVGYYEGFRQFDWIFIALLFAAWLLGEAAEFFSSAIGAKRAQASRSAIVAAYVGAFLGMLAGTAILPIIGTLAGSLLGAFGAGYWVEYRQTGSGMQAKKVAIHMLAGQLFGIISKLSIGLAMAIAIFLKLPIR